MGYTYLSREQWGAEYHVNQRALMKYLPTGEIFAHHTVTNASGDPAADMREIERIDMNRFGVPSYSWVYDPTTRTWMEGMGIHRGAHTINNSNFSFNDEAFGLSVIGNFNDDPFTDENVEDYASFIAGLFWLGFCSGDLNLRGHRDVFATACNGANFYARLPEIYNRAVYLINNPNSTPAPPPAPSEEFTVSQYDNIMLAINDLKANLPKTPIMFVKELKSVVRDGAGVPTQVEWYTDPKDVRTYAIYISRDSGVTMTWIKTAQDAADLERLFSYFPSLYTVLGNVNSPLGFLPSTMPKLVGDVPHL